MEHRFKYLKLGLRARLVAAAVLFAVATVVEVFSSFFVLGLPFIIAGWIVLALKPVSNKPKDQGLEEWRAVTDGEVARLADGIKRSRKLKLNLAGPTALKVVLLVVALIVTGISAAVSPRTSLALLNLCLFSVPGLFFGKLKVHLPVEFNLKMNRFLSMMNVPLPEGYVLTPYLRFDKDAEGRDVPEDLRMMLEPRRKPADLIGVQFQASINNGANGAVPYMYAVVLTKGQDGPAYRMFRTMTARGYEVEPGGDKDYGTVVVRQETSGGGYHTTDDDCESLFVLMMKALAKIES